ncbi:MAG TPA: ribose-5-phosphate isomerase RpiA [Candidatus Acidoferrales bacterium]|nr:ribose-5-phosphate isomerase RpiA [Candidatus Acidoferrales bacterium]
MPENIDPGKRAAGYAAVDRFVRNGTCIGLGTGTTAYFAIERVGQRVARGERIAAVPTSLETQRLCARWNVPVLGLLERPIDVAIDGADEVAADWSLTKGGGGALFREKAVALSADRFVVIVTPNKIVEKLGAFPTPVEIVPYAAPYVLREIGARWNGLNVDRRGGEAPYVTDNGNWILDCRFGRIDDPTAIDTALRAIHGVVSTGIFVAMAGEIIVGHDDGSATALPRSS